MVDDAVDEPEPVGFGRVDEVAGQAHLASGANPTASGSSTLIPPAGVKPTRAWVSPKRARSDAIRKSQASASSRPPVAQAPFIAPIDGGAHVRQRGERRVVAAQRARCDTLAELFQVEAGAERGDRLPVNTTQATDSSSSAFRSAAASSRREREREGIARVGTIERDDADRSVGGREDEGLRVHVRAHAHVFEEGHDRVVEEVVAVAGDHVTGAGDVDHLRVRHQLEELRAHPLR